MAFLLENAYNGSAMVRDAGNHPLLRCARKMATPFN
jgi:hypothetical protein